MKSIFFFIWNHTVLSLVFHDGMKVHVHVATSIALQEKKLETRWHIARCVFVSAITAYDTPKKVIYCLYLHLFQNDLFIYPRKLIKCVIVIVDQNLRQREQWIFHLLLWKLQLLRSLGSARTCKSVEFISHWNFSLVLTESKQLLIKNC